MFRSGRHIYAQVIDDAARRDRRRRLDQRKGSQGAKTWNVDAATASARRLPSARIAKGIKQVVFDRGGYIYHGRVKALADAAREGGLEF